MTFFAHDSFWMDNVRQKTLDHRFILGPLYVYAWRHTKDRRAASGDGNRWAVICRWSWKGWHRGDKPWQIFKGWR